MKYIKRISYIFVFIISLLFLSNRVNAAYVGKITGNGLSMRTESMTKISGVSLNVGDLLTVLDDTKTNIGKNSCNAGFVKTNHQGIEGYVCADYILKYSPSASCKKEIVDAGFSDTYVDYICSLKESHSNWIFKPIKVGVDFATAVEKESACGKSLIQSTSYHEEWGWIDNTCTTTEGSFVAASQKGVAYAMDPRNFINEKYIFQFESLKYENSLESNYISASKYIMKNASFYTYHASNNNIYMENVVNTAGKAKSINPISLSSRITQELGTGESEKVLYSGVYEGNDKIYYGYYNFFNIGVSGSCIKKYGIAMCGLDYAKDHGWNSVQNAVTGGADFLASGYINKGQYTSYLQKFNVVPTTASNIYVHQYMNNIAAPKSEALTSYNAYKSASMLTNSFVFYIPVYNNMDVTIINSSNGAVADNTSTDTSTSTTAVNTIVTGAGFKISGSNITGVNPGTTVDDIKAKIIAVGGSATVTPASGSYVGTGSTIVVSNKDTSITYKVIVKGDTSGDGKISALDLLQVQKHLLKTYTLSGNSASAGDTSGDGKISALDLLQIQKHLLKMSTISQ